MGPPAPLTPSLEEQQEIKRNAAKSIIALIPEVVPHSYYATNDEEVIVDQLEADLLSPFGDQYLNKHLVYGLVELILVKLIPELGEQSITDLLAERGVVLGEDTVGQQNELGDDDVIQEQ
ncbi:hypothetical protein H2198_007714 [Neophaeococcomyces mojaviensis]|uniref:Uncharacterized protein n=1 Tax=Neophaeococcomyces mojaviensis TaxID=3383035 RepID=A0ACC2ZZC0_9EURO|nr:hypothetical protein H2198_007714 [Knufia sp. JES_112]